MMLIESTATFKSSARLRSDHDRVAGSPRSSRRSRAYPPPRAEHVTAAVRNAEPAAVEAAHRAAFSGRSGSGAGAEKAQRTLGLCLQPM